MIDRTEVNRALAKAIAYKQCGKDSAAQAWAVKLITMLECENILTTSIRRMGRQPDHQPAPRLTLMTRIFILAAAILAIVCGIHATGIAAIVLTSDGHHAMPTAPHSHDGGKTFHRH